MRQLLADCTSSNPNYPCMTRAARSGGMCPQIRGSVRCYPLVFVPDELTYSTVPLNCCLIRVYDRFETSRVLHRSSLRRHWHGINPQPPSDDNNAQCIIPSCVPHLCSSILPVRRFSLYSDTKSTSIGSAPRLPRRRQERTPVPWSSSRILVTTYDRNSPHQYVSIRRAVG